MMNQALKELQQELLRKVGMALANLGFDSKQQGQAFYSATPFGWTAFHLSFIPHEVDFDVTADIGIRFDQVECIINEENSLLSNAEKKRTATMGAELGNIATGQPMRWRVASREDVNSVVEASTLAFEKVGLPYIAKYSNIEAAQAIMLRDDPTAWLNSPHHQSRLKRGVAITFLMRDDAMLEKVIKDCCLHLQRRRDPMLKQFEEFVCNILKKAEVRASVETVEDQ